EPFFAFGTNLTDSTQSKNRFAINAYNSVYQYFSNEEMQLFNGEKLVGLYNYRIDTSLNYNMMNDVKTSDKKVKAFIQSYNNLIIHNKISTQ
ncbi:MAG TPA: hypothetical protein VN698_09870, partial [Bacteroidia bacterium]|nr:hypothetical protein [Bacteroidia bacterium]